jgi:competence protein ComEA
MTLFLLQLPGLTRAQGAKVDLNRATIQQLDTLPGIGPAIAQRIVDFRDKNGPFKRIEDLMNVRGIGEKKFQLLQDRVTVGDAKPGKTGSNTAKRAGRPNS